MSIIVRWGQLRWQIWRVVCFVRRVRLKSGVIGFCLGLILIAPLGDLIENKLLILITLAGSVLSLLIAASAKTKAIFFIVFYIFRLKFI